MKFENLLIGALAILGLLFGVWFVTQPERSDIKEAFPSAKTILPFELDNASGGKFNLKSFENKLSVVSFGFTNCPDICPDTLTKYKAIKQLLAKNPKLVKDTQFIFVSVDPKRDSLKKLEEYVKYFDPTFIALTGNNDGELNHFSKQLLASYIVGDYDTDGYDVGHSAFLHIVDKEAKFTALVKSPFDVQQVVSLLTSLNNI